MASDFSMILRELPVNFKRIIPTLLLKGTRLAKGTHFRDHVDVGDPVSQAMVYDAQGADELMILDIAAQAEGRRFPSHVIQQINKKCRLPVAVGGGISSVKDAMELFSAGADKIVLNTAAFRTPQLVREIANLMGNQAVNIAIDVREENGRYRIYTEAGTKPQDIDLEDALKTFQDLGAGEFTLTNIDREGTLRGFDLGLYQKVAKVVTVPLIASGGCGRYQDVIDLAANPCVDGFGIGKMLCLRDYDVVRIKAFVRGKNIPTRDA
jgi:cyclase